MKRFACLRIYLSKPDSPEIAKNRLKANAVGQSLTQVTVEEHVLFYDHL